MSQPSKRVQLTKQDETFSPKESAGENFDDLMRRLVRVKPAKPKKGSQPKAD